MLVIDEVTRRRVDSRECNRVVVSIEDDQILFGYVKDPSKCVVAILYDSDGNRRSAIVLWDTMKDHLFFSNRQGLYISKKNVTQEFMIQEMYTRGRGIFPYNFSRRYEAIESFGIFKNKQQIINEKEFPLSKHLRYTFGLEFETSEGIVPENLCFRDGLIPLRDGSITGLEYSTVVLKGNEGLNLLAQQVETLKKYTVFNKECSLHIHLGGFPLTDKSLFRLYKLCLHLQNTGELASLLPPLTFRTSAYKNSGKDYCRPLPEYRDFKDLYYALVGEPFLGSFEQPHPNDPSRNQKWHIPTRYYWINFINAFCYKVNKTIEFRFLRPTYNLRKILVWMYIMNAILAFSEDRTMADLRNITFSKIFRRVYPEDLAKKLDLEVIKLQILVQTQVRNSNDKIGADLSIEDGLFPPTEII